MKAYNAQSIKALFEYALASTKVSGFFRIRGGGGLSGRGRNFFNYRERKREREPRPVFR